jgi:ubiquinone/menaquinone biosynthesis C-methylase UbiE
LEFISTTKKEKTMGDVLEKGYKGKGMDGFFARFYDKNARDHLIEQYKIWAQLLEKIIPKGSNLLEIAPCPGYLSIELAKAGIKNITGVDISETFVGISRKNAREANVSIEFIQGNASKMPFEDGQFTHTICTSAFKNFSDPLGALNEMYRVLMPGGMAWLCDMRQDVSNADIDAYVNNMMRLKGLNGLVTKMTFKYMLRKRAYTKEGILAMVSKTPFKVESFKQNVMEFYVTMRK